MEQFGIKRDLSVEKYLKRMKYSGTRECNLKNLSLLQLEHVTNVPYENLDIMARLPVSLAIPCVYDKIVNRKRGGYCFELNGLFSWLLGELGYAPVELYGRWLKYEELEVPPRRHRISRVILDGKQYICDVGVGLPAPRYPLLFEENLEQDQEGELYRIVSHPKMMWVVQEKLSSGWSNLYSFSEEAQQPVDFFLPHYYCTTHPDSIFLNDTMIYRRTEFGRNTVADIADPETNDNVVEFRVSLPDGGVGRFVPRNEEEFNWALKEYFDIVL